MQLHRRAIRVLAFLTLIALGRPTSAEAAEPPSIESLVTHGSAENGGVKIHFASTGSGPLVVMIHGFPDFWFTWRHQMLALRDRYQVVALDQRGYNLSDRPKGVEQYDMKLLAEDVAAVIRAQGRTNAVVMGHDWGGAVAWNFAMSHPEMTERLVILNLPHPRGFLHELASNPQQQANSSYARQFQKEGAHETLTAEALAGWVKDPVAKEKYLEAFRRSDFEAMLNYYKRNYPREPYVEPQQTFPKVQCPVLLIHGLGDKALLSGALNNTWDWIGSDLTLVTIPGAGHFVQHDATELVNRSIRAWMGR